MGTCDTPHGNKITEVESPNFGVKESDLNIFYMSRTTCKIIYKDIEGTGVFVKINMNNGELNCLMTNGHIIKKELFENKEKINVAYDWGQKIFQIQLDQNERFIKDFLDEGIDITIIQILPFDNINELLFLTPETNHISSFNNKKIYIPQFPLERNFFSSTGQIIKIDINEFTHDAPTITGSSGSPIFLENSPKVIGIYKSVNLSKTGNNGDFVYSVLQYFQNSIYNNEINDNVKKNITQNKVNFEYLNGNFYIGPLTNGLPHGVGKIYNGYRNLIYEGEMINGKKEGYGKRYYDNGYYIGQFSNDLKSGKGKYFFDTGEIYEGEFANDSFEGIGKYTYNNGNYYVGTFSNSLKHGKGKQFYKDGNLQYDIDFNHGKLEGQGRYNYENGEYYIGQCSNGLKHGKGTIYYKNGNIKYEGDFFQNKYEGQGRYNYENGEYYIGQFSKGLKHGKGTLCYENGKTKYEGDFFQDKYEGNGIFGYENGEYYIGQFSKGLKHGKGALCYENGTVKQEGLYFNDLFEG